MRRLTTLLFGMAVGGGLVFSAHHYHLVRTGAQFLLIPKIEVSLVDPYVDVRDWGLDDWEKHPQLLAAMKDHGHADLLPETRSGTRRGDSPGSSSDDSGDHLGTIPVRLVPRGLIPRSGARDDETARRECPSGNPQFLLHSRSLNLHEAFDHRTGFHQWPAAIRQCLFCVGC